MEPSTILPADIYTVSQFNELVNTMLADLGEVTIQGEISEVKVWQNKRIYFDIKDSASCISCSISPFQVDMPLAVGQEVVVTGSARIYLPSGRFGFNARSIQLKGEGAIQKAFRELQKKLQGEGLFDPRYKKPIPKFPERIGIITSKDGAAINDILKVLGGRMGGLELFLAPVQVQGAPAPDELCGAIHYFNAYKPVDVIIFGRGGGSLEDLQAFNSEKVARAIFASKIPIISGIGHEHNTSIADLVADVRAATPSNAAELCVPDRQALQHKVNVLKQQLNDNVDQLVWERRHAITKSMELLPQLVQTQVQHVRGLVRHFAQSLHYAHQSVDRNRLVIKTFEEKLVLALDKGIGEKKNQLQQLQAVLAVVSPNKVLERGYTITYDAATKQPITSQATAPTNGKLTTKWHDGEITSVIGSGKINLITVKQQENQAQLFETHE